MNAGLQTSEDYLQIWHSYMNFLKRNYCSNSNTNENKEILIEEIRDSFQKAIDQLFECKLTYLII